MTIAYPLKSNQNASEDLIFRYSLRSVEKYGTGVHRLMVIGPRRSWFSDKVEVCNLKDEPTQSKFNRVARRLVTFCDADIPFVLMNDDFILGQDYDFTARRWYVDGTVEGKITGTNDKTYKRFVQKTMRGLVLTGKEPSHMNHTPMLIQQPQRVSDLWREKKMYSCGAEVSFRQSAGSLLPKQSNFIERDDVKIRSPRNAAQWATIFDGDIVSLSPQCTDDVMFAELEKRFPNKSIWER